MKMDIIMTDTLQPHLEQSHFHSPEVLMKMNNLESTEFSLFLPAYNEGLRTEEGGSPGDPFRDALETYSEELYKKYGRRHQFFVVDDGSTDNGETSRIAREHGVQVVNNPNGKTSIRGGAYKVGYEHAHGEVIGSADADLSYSFKTISAMADKVESGEYRVAIAYRDGESDHPSLVRKVGHTGMHLFCEYFAPTGVRDPQAGAKVFHKDAAALLWPQVESDEWAADREVMLLARLYGLDVYEQAAFIQARGGSTVDLLLDPLRMARDAIRMGVNVGLEDKRIRKNLGKLILPAADNIVDLAEYMNKKNEGRKVT